MANKRVSILRYCKVDGQWRRLPVVIGGNNRVRPGWVKEPNGEEVHHPEGYYVLRYYAGSKVRYEAIGDNAAEALSKWHAKQRTLSAKESAGAAGLQIVEEAGRVRLKTALDAFIKSAEDREANVNAKVHALAGREFLDDIQKTFVDEVTLSDFDSHQRKLRSRGRTQRTIANRFASLISFAKYAGVKASEMPTRKPKFEKKQVQVYTADERRAFFAALTDDSHRVFFNLALQCGLRERELMFLQWPDIDWTTNTVTVRSKPEHGFQVKDYEVRSVRFSPELAALLNDYRQKHPQKVWVTGTSRDTPNNHWLRTLKRIVKRAHLSCNTCKSCAKHGECSNWFLHKFRSTFATKLLRDGMDVASVQKVMGHSDLASTMRYLRPQDDDVLQARMSGVNWLD